MSSHLPLSASSEQKLLMILSALTQLLSLCLSDFQSRVPSCTSLPRSPAPGVFFSVRRSVARFNSAPPLCLQTSSPAAPRPPRAPRRHPSPRCQRSASPHHWGSARWGRFPCPKTSSTNRPWRRRRGRTCPTRPTPRGSGAVKHLHYTPEQTPIMLSARNSANILYGTLHYHSKIHYIRDRPNLLQL